jgi:hypothetical protein
MLDPAHYLFKDQELREPTDAPAICAAVSGDGAALEVVAFAYQGLADIVVCRPYMQGSLVRVL